MEAIYITGSYVSNLCNVDNVKTGSSAKSRRSINSAAINGLLNFKLRIENVNIVFDNITHYGALVNKQMYS
jgi:hypothetical protein